MARHASGAGKRKLVLLACVVVALIAAAWWLLGDDGGAIAAPDVHLDTPREVVVGPDVEPVGESAVAIDEPTPLAPRASDAEQLAAPRPQLAPTVDDLPRRDVRVVTADGAAVSEARVVLTTAEPREVDTLGTTGADGRAAIEPTTFGRLHAVHDELGESRRWRLEAFASDAPLTLTLRPAGVVDGLVQDDLGQPAVGARVHASGGASTREHAVPTPERVEADDDGRFVLRVSGWWDGTLHAERDGFRSPDLTAVPGQPHLLRLPARYAIRGRVVDARGEPLERPFVTVWYDQQHVAPDARRSFRRRTYGRGDGGFAVFVDGPGDYVVSALVGERPPGDVARARIDEGTPQAHALLVVPEAARITGRVVDGRGDPVRRAIVRARPAHLYEPAQELFGPTPFTRFGKADDVTDADGRFELGPLRARAEYIVFCRPVPNEPDRKVVLKGVRGDTTELSIVASEETLRRATWSGAVFAEATGIAVTDPRLSLAIRLDGQVLSADLTPDVSPDGTFTFTGLAPGYAYRLRVDGDGTGAWEGPWWTAAIPGRHDVVHLPPPARLEVTTGRPGAMVELRRTDATFGVDRTVARRAGADGKAFFDDVVAGRYEITAPKAGTAVTLEHGETVRVTL